MRREIVQGGVRVLLAGAGKIYDVAQKRFAMGARSPIPPLIIVVAIRPLACPVRAGAGAIDVRWARRPHSAINVDARKREPLRQVTSQPLHTKVMLGRNNNVR